MSENLSKAAEALGIPEALVRRSAEARAAATGVPVDEIIAAWASGGEAPTTETPKTEPAPTTPPEPTPEAAPTPEETPSEPAPAPAAPAPAPPEPAPAAPPPPGPTEVDPREALDHPVVVSVPTAGLAERTTSAVPRWMAALFFVLPLIGLLYLAGSGGEGVCVEGGVELAVDRMTGVPVNCDGSDFVGRGGGGGGVDFIALGERIYRGEEVAAASCAACHGANGEGGVGPALTGVLSTFGACGEQVRWVQLGSAGWPEGTYGDLGTPVAGGMPGFASSLTEEQLRAVTAFERVRFGGGDPDQVLADCGLGGGEAGGEAEGEAGAAGAGLPADVVALGERIYRGEEVAAANCAACHGANGEGGVGPALTGVLSTFGACEDHVKWIELGSAGWPEGTYGDLGTPVAGGMPGFASSLTEEQLRAVTAFERIRFGGAAAEDVLIDCAG